MANMASDAVAVIDTKKLTGKTSKTGMAEPEGFVPTEWMPMSMAFSVGGAFCCDRQGQGHGAESVSSEGSETGRGNAEEDELHRDSALWIVCGVE